jgi:hypothetical protein
LLRLSHQKNEIGETFSTPGGDKNEKDLSESLKRREHLEDLAIAGRIM